MKKNNRLALAAVLVLLVFLLCSCGNKTFFDTTYRFDYAMIQLPDGGIVQGTVETWKDFEDGDQIQVKIDGTTYLVHSENVVLMAN